MNGINRADKNGLCETIWEKAELELLVNSETSEALRVWYWTLARLMVLINANLVLQLVIGLVLPLEFALVFHRPIGSTLNGLGRPEAFG